MKLLIDPGIHSKKFWLMENKFRQTDVEIIILTHMHYDHIATANEYENAKIYCSKQCKADKKQLAHLFNAKPITINCEIIPEKITVAVGTCTVWINWVTGREVRVSFRENAKQCTLSTEASTGFDELELKSGESCYISETLPRGKTASLVWTKPGTYKYNLEALRKATTLGAYSGDIIAKGVIEVK